MCIPESLCHTEIGITLSVNLNYLKKRESSCLTRDHSRALFYLGPILM